MRTSLIATLLVLCGICFSVTVSSAAFVTRIGGKTYIVDRTGERWDVTQAESIGFKPGSFQYGIGKNAFTPLDDTHISDDPSSFNENPRIIGVTDGTEARAYSIPKLRYHEIANTRLGEKPIAAGY
ncbi:MAG: DUF3179 domain-containing protein [Deltaproteobacteria bacterium]|nr:DUF3179 domain-containing protein [Deltaproteobacteria bacterium]MBW2193363.1 DUF3179 domain-containing protein [Deltaproteobacteria bacterium]